jgi:hypothetical protein
MYQNHENPSVPPGVEANQRSCPSQACLCHQLLPIENMSTHVLSQVCQHRQSPKINNNALQGDVSQPYISSAGMMRTYRAYVKRHKLNMTEILRHIFSILCVVTFQAHSFDHQTNGRYSCLHLAVNSHCTGFVLHDVKELRNDLVSGHRVSRGCFWKNDAWLSIQEP